MDNNGEEVSMSLDRPKSVSFIRGSSVGVDGNEEEVNSMSVGVVSG